MRHDRLAQNATNQEDWPGVLAGDTPYGKYLIIRVRSVALERRRFGLMISATPVEDWT